MHVIRVEAVQCPYCRDVLISLDQHDFHWCSCEATAVDGGRMYLRVTYRDRANPPKTCFILIDKDELMGGTGVYRTDVAIDYKGTYTIAEGNLKHGA